MNSFLNTRVSNLRSRTEAHSLSRQFSEVFANSATDVYVLQAHEFSELWLQKQLSEGKSEQQAKASFESVVGFGSDLVREHSSTISSVAVLSALAADMRRSGSIFATYRNVRRGQFDYIIFQGNPDLRKHIKPRIFFQNNPTMIKLGVGKAAAGAMLRGGLLLTIIVSPAMRTFEWLFGSGRSSIESVLGNVATDVVKASIAAAAGYAVMAPLAAAPVAIAVLPLAVGIVVGVAVGAGLNYLDNRFGITDQIIDAMIAKKEDWLERTSAERRQFFYYLFSSEGGLRFIQRMTPGSGFRY